MTSQYSKVIILQANKNKLEQNYKYKKNFKMKIKS